MVPVIAIYTRISSDPLGQSTSTSRQERLCRAFAAIRGWDVAGVYEDIDLSAYQQRVHRPAFERLQADLPGLDGVLVWRLDRLVRRPADFERFWGRCEEVGSFLASATEPVDSSSEMGVAILRILVTFAQLESHARSERLRAKAEEVARTGAPPTKKPCYGHSDGWRTIVPHEAELIREAARRYVEGESLRDVARSFNDEGRLTRGGHLWKDSTLFNLLIAHRLVGDRSYHGEFVARGDWPAILDREVFEAIQSRAAARRKNNSPMRGLLTGLLICARCGGRLVIGNSNHHYRTYTCRAKEQNERLTATRLRRCALSILAPATDAWVQHQVIWRSRFVAKWDAQLLRLVPTPLTVTSWSLLTLDEQRTHVRVHLQRLIIRPSVAGAHDWDVERLLPTWTDELVDPPPFEWKRQSYDRMLQEQNPDHISGAGAAKMLGVPSWKVNQLRKSGDLIAVGMSGNRWIYSRAATEETKALLHSRLEG